jgi:hypothetical protein
VIKRKKMSEETKVVAQIVGYKNLKIAGGMRVEIDLFEARETDILKMVLLANRKEVVTMTLEPYRPKEGKVETKGKKEFKDKGAE